MLGPGQTRRALLRPLGRLIAPSLLCKERLKGPFRAGLFFASLDPPQRRAIAALRTVTAGTGKCILATL
jgi:hypothetical protein